MLVDGEWRRRRRLGWRCRQQRQSGANPGKDHSCTHGAPLFVQCEVVFTMSESPIAPMGRPFNGIIAIPLTEKLLPLYGAQKRQETTPPAIILGPLWVRSNL